LEGEGACGGEVEAGGVLEDGDGLGGDLEVVGVEEGEEEEEGGGGVLEGCLHVWFVLDGATLVT